MQAWHNLLPHPANHPTSIKLHALNSSSKWLPWREQRKEDAGPEWKHIKVSTGGAMG